MTYRWWTISKGAYRRVAWVKLGPLTLCYFDWPSEGGACFEIHFLNRLIWASWR
jgi:hypothetical protein